jgi:hypothetical protein
MIRKFAIRRFAMAAACLAAMGLTVQGAQAHSGKKKLLATEIVVGGAATAAYFAIGNWRWNGWDNGFGITRLGAAALTTVGCAAVSPMVATAVLARPLTQREAHVLIGSCVVPIVGGWLVEAAYDAHPDWEPAAPPKKKKWKKK